VVEEVRLQKITKRYGDFVAVSEVDLSVGKGEYHFILGPSGCGKTVLLRLISGLEMPSSGDIYIGNVRVNEIPAHERRIPVVFQNFALFPHLNVRENIEYGLRIRGGSKHKKNAKSDALLEMLGISEMAAKKPHQLSAGQRQRVGLGRALAVEPEILLLDEPLGALDANLHINMQFELKTIQKELGVTFLQVTHNQSDALAVADWIVVINKGRVEQVGTPSEIFSAPKTGFVAKLLENNNIFEGTVVGRSDKSIEIETGDGIFSVPTEDTCPSLNNHVTFVVRHDKLIVDPRESNLNKFEANFRGRTVRGNLVIYEFVRKHRSFKIESYISSGLLNFEPGIQVNLGWSSSDAYLLPVDNS